jgi:hypothetical protein
LDLTVISGRFLKAVLLLGFVVIGSIYAGSAQAQEVPAKDPKAEYKTSLDSLSVLYKNDVDRLEKQQQQSKALYDDGLISRLILKRVKKRWPMHVKRLNKLQSK